MSNILASALEKLIETTVVPDALCLSFEATGKDTRLLCRCFITDKDDQPIIDIASFEIEAGTEAKIINLDQALEIKFD